MTPHALKPGSSGEGHESADVLVAFAAGLLSSRAEARVTAHLESCPDCHESFEALTAREDWESPGGEHLPAAMLARWPKMQRELRSVERDLVRKHLERCDSCRTELTTLGFDPILAPLAATEAVQAMPPARERARQRRAVPSPGWWREATWPTWVMGSWAAAATAVAGYALVANSVLTQAPVQMVANLPVTGQVEPARIQLLTAQFPEGLRDGSASPPPILLTIEPGQSLLCLPPPRLPAYPANRPVTLEVRTPSDSLLCSLQTTLGKLDNLQALPVSAGSWKWVEGTYRLVAVTERGAGAEPWSVPFRVQLSR